MGITPAVSCTPFPKVTALTEMAEQEIQTYTSAGFNVCPIPLTPDGGMQADS